MARTLTRVPCDRCKAPQLDGAHVCGHDTAYVRDLIDEALDADWIGELHTNITLKAVTAGHRHHRGDDTVPLPVDLHAADVRRGILATLHGLAARLTAEWGRPVPAPRAPRLLPKPPREYEGPSCGWDECWHPVCVATRRHTRTPRDIEPGEAAVVPVLRHIRDHLDRVRFHAWADAFMSDIERVLWLARVTVDTTPERRYLGRCWMPTADPDGTTTIDCPTAIIAVVGAVTTTCRGCGHVWDVKARYDWLMREIRDNLATVDELAAFLPQALGAPIPKATIKSWTKRSLERRGTRDGIAVYRFGQAFDLAIRSLQWKARRETTAKKKRPTRAPKTVAALWTRHKQEWSLTCP